jgi:hypothetical protein
MGNWQSLPSEHQARIKYWLNVLFGDLRGLILFVCALIVFGLVWRIAPSINDTVTLANGLYALEQGSLELQTARYGAGLETPGAELYDGARYARNYGILVTALPVVIALRVVKLFSDLHIALIGGWSLLILVVGSLVGTHFDRQEQGIVYGSIAAIALFVLNVSLAHPIGMPGVHIVALQLVHMIVGGMTVVMIYRLLSTHTDSGRGLVGVVFVLAGTPLTFWASIPKRHIITAAIIFTVALAIAKSRQTNSTRSLRTRALAYASVGFLAWVHGPEALVVLVALVIVDIPTAPSNDKRTLGYVGGVFLCSLIPMFLTNYLISGNPLRVPRMLGRSQFAGGGTTSGGGSSGTLPPQIQPLIALLDKALSPLTSLIRLIQVGINTLLFDPEQVYRTIIRRGYVYENLRGNDTMAANLSLLEAAPLIAGLLAFLPDQLRKPSEGVINEIQTRTDPSDWFLLIAAVCYTLMYLSRLPIHAQVTVRYLFPLYPLAIYAIVRGTSIGSIVGSQWRPFAWTYAFSVLIGGQLLLVGFWVLGVSRGEAFQAHALLALGIATPLGIWALLAPRTGRWRTTGAVLTALATASATLFVAFATLEYFTTGTSNFLPIIHELARFVSFL